MTFVFDAYKDLSLAQLKQRCRHLVRHAARQERIILKMSTVPGAMDVLRPEDREKVQLLIRAYED